MAALAQLAVRLPTRLAGAAAIAAAARPLSLAPLFAAAARHLLVAAPLAPARAISAATSAAVAPAAAAAPAAGAAAALWRRACAGAEEALGAAVWLVARTFWPSVVRKKRTHGFLHRNASTSGRRVLARRRRLGRKTLCP